MTQQRVRVLTPEAAATGYASVITVTDTRNISATLQAAFDNGVRRIRLQGGGIGILNGPIFLDATSSRVKYAIEGDGFTTLQLAAGLPGTPAYTPDPTTGWAFHLNTNRSALSGGVVTCTDATRSTGAGYPTKPRLVLRNLILDGAALNAGFVFGNTAAAAFDDCAFRLVKRAHSWRSYADGAAIRGGQIINATTGAWLIDQIDNGDGVVIDNFKGETSGVWRAVNCNGGHVTGGINGQYRFKNCRGIRISDHHTEADRTFPDNLPMFDIDCSTVVLDQVFGYAGYSGSRYMIHINDTAGESHSDVEIRSPYMVTYLGDTPDRARLPDVYIAAMNGSSRLRVTSPSGVVSVAAGGNSALHSRDGMLIASAVPAIQSALDSARATLASSSWMLRRRNTTWEVLAPGPLAGIRASRVLLAPSITSLVVSDVVGGLTSNTYEYAIALRDADGYYTGASAASSVVGAAGYANLLLTTIPVTPATLVVWRKAATGVLAAPDAYVEIPVDGYLVRLYDTGSYVNGRPWITSGVPAAATVAAANTTFDRLILPNGSIIAAGDGSPNGRIAALGGSLYLRKDGDAFTSLYRKTTDGGNNGWIGPRGTPGTILGATSYRPGTATSNDITSTTFVDADATNLAVSFVAPDGGRVIVKLSCDAAAVTASSDYYWNLRDAVGDVSGSDFHAGFTTSPSRITAEFMMTGLSTGTTYTWKWGVRASASANAARLRYGGQHGAAFMSVTTAP